MIAILGAGGHGAVVASAIRQLDLEYKFFDDKTDQLIASRNLVEFIVAIGDNKIREQIYLNQTGWPVTIIHPSAIVPGSIVICDGTFIGAGVIINACAEIGNNAILNSGCIIEHHCVIRDHAHIAPGATLCGNVEIGEGALVGANSVVLSNVPEWSTVRAGSLYEETND